MKRTGTKRFLMGTLCVVALLGIVLAVHIYMVTHKPADPNRVAMARIDIATDINEQDAKAITEWLYHQQGIDHVLCNPNTNIAVFTFYPARVKADHIVSSFCASSGYSGVRFMPDAKTLKGGCPVSVGSSGSWLSAIYKKISFFPLTN